MRFLSSTSSNKIPKAWKPTLQYTSLKYAAVAVGSLTVGFCLGQRYQHPHHPLEQPGVVLPNGYPRTCCDQKETPPLTDQQKQLLGRLIQIVGSENVLQGRASVNPEFLKGMRLGQGDALCVVTPRRLPQVVQCVKEIVQADCTILPQGQNTGLTGGSVPRPSTDQRPTVLLSLKYLDTILPMDSGTRVLCLAGVGLASLSNFLFTYFDRDSHSVLGSTFLNPTTAAGVALGSGGTQIRKGPASTERALYLKVDKNKWNEVQVHLVDTLQIQEFLPDDDQDTPILFSPFQSIGPNRVSVLKDLDAFAHRTKMGYLRDFLNSAYPDDDERLLPSSDTTYAQRLCQDDDNVSRFNADTRGLDCNRSEGKVILLATVHDTFPRPKSTKTFWISLDSLETAVDFRKQVALANPQDLPISMEYMDRDAFHVIDRSGRILGNLIKAVGPNRSLIRTLWKVKLWVEGLPLRGAPFLVDRLLHGLNPWVPRVLPRPIHEMGESWNHHLAMTVGDFDGENMDRIIRRMQDFQAKMGKDRVVIQECQGAWDESALTAFRFVAAPAFRTWCVGEGMQGFSVDYALPKNMTRESAAPPEALGVPMKRMRYSHFGCNVVHEDLAYGVDVDVHKAKMALKRAVEQSGGKLPAEHGHGTEYIAPPETQERWKKMDPLNVCNPGVGGTSSDYKYGEE